MFYLSFVAGSLLMAIGTDMTVLRLWALFFLLTAYERCFQLVALQELTLHFPLLTLACYEAVQIFCLFYRIVMQGGDLAHMTTGWYLYCPHLYLFIDTSGSSFSDGHGKRTPISNIHWRWTSFFNEKQKWNFLSPLLNGDEFAVWLKKSNLFYKKCRIAIGS